MKVEAENPAAKKRKTDWVNGLKKMPGDTTLAKDTFLKNTAVLPFNLLGCLLGQKRKCLL